MSRDRMQACQHLEMEVILFINFIVSTSNFLSPNFTPSRDAADSAAGST
jgi:hypothetical protein